MSINLLVKVDQEITSRSQSGRDRGGSRKILVTQEEELVRNRNRTTHEPDGSWDLFCDE